MASILEGDSLDLQTADGDDAFASWPAPLVLPGDDLALDPYYPPQSLQQWQHEEHRNEVTSRKNVIYVAACPEPKPEVDFMRKWTQPQQQPLGDRQQSVKPPQAQDVIEYVAAFYHGLSVKLLPSRLSFTKWDDSDPEHGIEFEAPDYVGLRTATECVRIRARTSVDGLFHQLNLDDLLDAAIAILPSDAYALLLLVDHDIYENDDDDFACGRAYGGSRVAVVSSARYNPVLDDREGIEREHAWPASHCEAYLQTCNASASKASRRSGKKQKTSKSNRDQFDASSSLTSSSVLQPMRAAVSAHKATGPVETASSTTTASELWLSRVCRTASHELGHCFGIDHCVYFACNMQGCSSLNEDARQPPYLCPIDLAKVLRATGTIAEERYRMLLHFCTRHEGSHLFSAFAGWLRNRLPSNRVIDLTNSD